MRVYLVRHGITDACGLETVNNIKPNKDVSLSELGRQQVKKACLQLPRNISKIYTSPTLRTIETSEIIKDYYHSNVEIIPDVRIKNKIQIMDTSYPINLQGFLQELSLQEEEDIVIVTHGRIIKMLYSLTFYKCIDCNFMDSLEIDYGDVFEMEYTNGNFEFLKWK
jgi:broad specificity phosphatase PhoE